jgi:hypothetical protein
MNRFYTSSLAVITLAIICLLCWTTNLHAQQTMSLGVESPAICRDVVGREPVDPGYSFPASVGKLYCYTKIVKVQGPDRITHVWYYGSIERARVSLRIDSPSWRTWSSKIIQAHEIGAWHVDVLGPGGEKLDLVPFEITR